MASGKRHAATTQSGGLRPTKTWSTGEPRPLRAVIAAPSCISSLKALTWLPTLLVRTRRQRRWRAMESARKWTLLRRYRLR